MTKIPSTWNDNTLACFTADFYSEIFILNARIQMFLTPFYCTQITKVGNCYEATCPTFWALGHGFYQTNAKLQYPQWWGHWKSSIHTLSCQFFMQNDAESESKNCIQLLPRGCPNGVDSPLQYPTAFWGRAWKRPRDLSRLGYKDITLRDVLRIHL